MRSAASEQTRHSNATQRNLLKLLFSLDIYIKLFFLFFFWVNMNYNQSYLIFLTKAFLSIAFIWCIYSLNFDIWFFSSCQRAVCLFKLLLESSRRGALADVERGLPVPGTRLNEPPWIPTRWSRIREQPMNVEPIGGSPGSSSVSAKVFVSVFV